MQTFRYVVAVLFVTIVPASMLYWLLLHPMVGMWRKMGVAATQSILWGIVLLTAAALYTWRADWLASEFGFNPLIFGAGVLCILGAAVYRLRIEKYLNWRVQLGLPEIAPQKYPQALVTNGPYAHVRNPRYIQAVIALLGWSLIANYPAVYLASALWIPAFWVIARFEESELRRRFGAGYEEYVEKTGRFWARAPETNHRVRA